MTAGQWNASRYIMYKILIVDDEPAIVNGMEKLIYESINYEIEIYKAHSGISALEIIKHTRMDVVMTDIRMPGLTGLQLFDHIVFYWPACKVIFLTGYNDFDFIYEAIHKHDVDYFLKTESDGIIISALKKTINKIEDEKKQWDIFTRAQKQMEEILPLLRKEMFESILYGENNDVSFLMKRFEQLKIRLDANTPVLIVTGMIQAIQEGVCKNEKLGKFCSIQSIFNMSLEPYIISESVILDKVRLIWFLQPVLETKRFNLVYGEHSWKDVIVFIKGQIEIIQNMCRDILGISISFVIAGCPVSWDLLYNEFDRMKDILNRTYIYRSQYIIDLGVPDKSFGMKICHSHYGNIDFRNKLKLFEDSLEKMLDAEVEKHTRKLVSLIKSDFNSNYLIGMERYHQFTLIFISFINKYCLFEKLNGDIRLYRLRILESPGEWDETEKHLVGLGRYLCMLKSEIREEEGNHIIKQLHDYIKVNLDGDISLTRLAEIVYLNPSYLSRYYKLITGNNLSSYINEVKLEEAKRMLEDKDIKVNEIALKLGFESQSYFTSFFKKLTGMTPIDFRGLLYSQGKL